MKKYIFLKKYKEYKKGEIGSFKDKKEIDFLLETGTIQEFDDKNDKSEKLISTENEELKKKNEELLQKNEELKKEIDKLKIENDKLEKKVKDK